MTWNMDINSKFKFGKYKGFSFTDVDNNHPYYIKWCLENNVITLTDTARGHYEERMERCSNYGLNDDDASELSFCMGLDGGGQG